MARRAIAAGWAARLLRSRSRIRSPAASGCSAPQKERPREGKGTRPVRPLHPNEFSLYDTHGNAWETDSAEDRRAMRGSTPDVVRLANRGREYADMRFTSGGFRFVRQLAP